MRLHLPVFVVHDHFAKRRHHDLRLELDSVLASWVVPKGVPLEKNVKRLAVRVDDHALDYASFEGVIPEGAYGAGRVKIWDEGRFVLKKRVADEIVFEPCGKKMRGEYALLDFKKDGRNWLLFKTKLKENELK